MLPVRSAPCRVIAIYRASWVTRPAPSRPAALANALLAEARRSLTHLAASNGPELFLANGSRLSVDEVGLLRVETPECRDPSLAVLYVRAGERILLELADRTSLGVTGAIAIERVGGGCHTSFLLPETTTDWADRLLPFVISRMIYAGTGGFDPTTASLRFILSPEAHQSESNPARLLKGDRVSRLRLKRPILPGRWFHVLAGDHATTALPTGRPSSPWGPRCWWPILLPSRPRRRPRGGCASHAAPGGPLPRIRGFGPRLGSPTTTR